MTPLIWFAFVGVAISVLLMAIGAMILHQRAASSPDNVKLPLINEPAPENRIINEEVSKALLNKGVALDALGHHEEAIAVYDSLLARFGSASKSSVRDQIAKALVNKGIALSRLNRGVEAIATYDDLLARFDAVQKSCRPCENSPSP